MTHVSRMPYLAQRATSPGTRAIDFGPAYQLNETSFFPSLAPRQLIPSHLQSTFAQPGRPSRVGMGVVLAVCSMLSPKRILGFALSLPQDARGTLPDPAAPSVTPHWSLQCESYSRPGTRYQLGGTPSTWWIDHPSYLTAIAALVDALTLGRQEATCQEFVQRWSAFLQMLEQELLAPPPYTEQHLLQAARSVDCTHAMMAVTDALYFAAQQRGPAIFCLAQPDPSPDPHQPGTFERWIYLQQPGVSQSGGSGPVGGGTLGAGYPGSRPAASSASASSHRASSHRGSAPPASAVPQAAPMVSSPGHQRHPATHRIDRSEEASASSRPTPLSTTSPAALGTVDTGTLATLQRCLRRGSTVLLVGPTGIGKSVVARQAAVAEQIAMVLIEGRPGLEDRDLYGKVYPQEGPSGQTFRWVDGPLTEAWRTAASGQRVVLIMDELARFDPYYLAPLTGSLDKVRGDELRLVVGISPVVLEHVESDAEYRVLKLPTGERLAAPARLLSVIATTNLGSDYIQTQSEFDAALLGRFEIQLDIVRLDADTRSHILAHQHQLPGQVATLMVQMEDYTIYNTAAHNGLLRRELNLRTCIHWATEASDLVRAGMSWAEAIRVAASATVIPFCCSRSEDGYLDRPSSQALRDEIRRKIVSLAI